MSRNSTPILTLTQTLSGTVAQSRFVTPAGAQAGADANTLGVARAGGVSGEKVPVDVLGTAVVQSGGSFSAGATLKADTNGKAIVWASSGAKVAMALEASTGADQFVEVLLIPNVA